MLNSQLLHPPIPPNYNYLPHTYIAFFNNNCCQCLLLLHPGLSKKLQGAGKCAVSVPAYWHKNEKPSGISFCSGPDPWVHAGFTQAQPAPTISCNCVESLGAVVGCQQIKKSEVLPPQARPAGDPLAHPSPQSRALGQWCTAP